MFSGGLSQFSLKGWPKCTYAQWWSMVILRHALSGPKVNNKKIKHKSNRISTFLGRVLSSVQSFSERLAYQVLYSLVIHLVSFYKSQFTESGFQFRFEIRCTVSNILAEISYVGQHWYFTWDRSKIALKSFVKPLISPHWILNLFLRLNFWGLGTALKLLESNLVGFHN